MPERSGPRRPTRPPRGGAGRGRPRREDPEGPAPEFVYGVHPVRELIEARGPEIERIYVAEGRVQRMGRLLREAREAGVPVSHMPTQVLERKVGRGAVHQGVAAQVATRAYADVDRMCREAAAREDSLLVVVDGVVDPRNLGAILRTAAAAGAGGIVLGSEGTVGVTPTVAKTSAGAVERIEIGRDRAIPRRIRWLREHGFRAYLLDPRSSEAWDQADLTGRIVLVAGGEERGVRPGVARACDGRLTIPLAAGVESLNVAVALGVLLFEASRQRRRRSDGP